MEGYANEIQNRIDAHIMIIESEIEVIVRMDLWLQALVIIKHRYICGARTAVGPEVCRD